VLLDRSERTFEDVALFLTWRVVEHGEHHLGEPVRVRASQVVAEHSRDGLRVVAEDAAPQAPSTLAARIRSTSAMRSRSSCGSDRARSAFGAAAVRKETRYGFSSRFASSSRKTGTPGEWMIRSVSRAIAVRVSRLTPASSRG
jgi:hypothetical protein